MYYFDCKTDEHGLGFNPLNQVKKKNRRVVQNVWYEDARFNPLNQVKKKNGSTWVEFDDGKRCFNPLNQVKKKNQEKEQILRKEFKRF